MFPCPISKLTSSNNSPTTLPLSSLYRSIAILDTADQILRCYRFSPILYDTSTLQHRILQNRNSLNEEVFNPWCMCIPKIQFSLFEKRELSGGDLFLRVNDTGSLLTAKAMINLSLLPNLPSKSKLEPYYKWDFDASTGILSVQSETFSTYEGLHLALWNVLGIWKMILILSEFGHQILDLNDWSRYHEIQLIDFNVQSLQFSFPKKVNPSHFPFFFNMSSFILLHEKVLNSLSNQHSFNFLASLR